MRDDFEIYPNREEAVKACIEFNDQFQELMTRYKVYMTGDDSCSFKYVTTRYYDESGRVKEYVLY